MKEETANVTTYQYLPPPPLQKTKQTNGNGPQSQRTMSTEPQTIINNQKNAPAKIISYNRKQNKQNTLNNLQTSVRFRSKFMLSHIDLCKFTKKKFTMFT